MKKILSLATLPLIFFASVPADSFSLSSEDIEQGKPMSKTLEYNGFGCQGGNLSPHLAWSSIPEGTQSFAITVHDPDAPTDSGWWHWQIVNIPKTVTEIMQGAGDRKGMKAPEGSLQTENDYGFRGFGGACPPKGHGIHRYRFTVHALSVEKLDLPDNATAALASFMINAHSLASDTIETLYERQ